jgi:hypothetical protein
VTLLAAVPVAGVLGVIGAEEAGAERPHERLQRRTAQRNRKQRTRRRKNQNNQNKNTNNGGGGNNNGSGGRGNLGASDCLSPQSTDLQQAINAASPFANLVLCAGVFQAPGLRINQDLTLIGTSATDQTPGTMLIGTNNSGVLGVVSGNVLISNLTISGANGDVPAIGLEGGSLTPAAVQVEGNSDGGS